MKKILDSNDSVTVLIVDDDEAVRDSLAEYLGSNGWTVVTADRADRALTLLKEGVGDIVISDIRMPGMSGLDLLRAVKELDLDIDVLLATGFSSEDTAIEALRNGAFDYFRKPLRAAEVETSLQRTRRMHLLRRENRRLKGLLAKVGQADERYRFVGRSKDARALLSKLNKVSLSANTTVLLTGESGTGKEVAARMIHQLSRPDDSSFVAVNCGGLPDTLLESELFGHEKGAFTGADKRVPGVFELAAGGTVLLDEISEMSMQAQTRFLRVLEDRRFMRLGGGREVSLDNTRIIAATNRDLEESVRDGSFRQDLFFRISVAPIHITPLRERRDDILPLAFHFLERFAKEMARPFELVSASEKLLEAYDYPGNARDLRNIIERACIFSESDRIQPDDLGLPSRAKRHATSADQAAWPETLDLAENEKLLVEKALKLHPDNHSAASRALGISPQALYRKIDKHEIGRDG